MHKGVLKFVEFSHALVPSCACGEKLLLKGGGDFLSTQIEKYYAVILTIIYIHRYVSFPKFFGCGRKENIETTSHVVVVSIT